MSLQLLLFGGQLGILFLGTCFYNSDPYYTNYFITLFFHFLNSS